MISTRTVFNEINSSLASTSSSEVSLFTASIQISVSSSSTPTCPSLLLAYSKSRHIADYRKRPRALSKVYFDPLNETNRTEMSKLFHSACSAETPPEEIVSSRILSVWGRQLHIPLSTSKVALFKFSDLCGGPHSAADYLEITKAFSTVFLTEVPQLGLETKDQARRFILFIDAAYEARVSPSISFSHPPALAHLHMIGIDKTVHSVRSSNSRSLLR